MQNSYLRFNYYVYPINSGFYKKIIINRKIIESYETNVFLFQIKTKSKNKQLPQINFINNIKQDLLKIHFEIALNSLIFIEILN